MAKNLDFNFLVSPFGGYLPTGCYHNRRVTRMQLQAG